MSHSSWCRVRRPRPRHPASPANERCSCSSLPVPQLVMPSPFPPVPRGQVRRGGPLTCIPRKRGTDEVHWSGTRAHAGPAPLDLASRPFPHVVAYDVFNRRPRDGLMHRSGASSPRRTASPIWPNTTSTAARSIRTSRISSIRSSPARGTTCSRAPWRRRDGPRNRWSPSPSDREQQGLPAQRSQSRMVPRIANRHGAARRRCGHQLQRRHDDGRERPRAGRDDPCGRALYYLANPRWEPGDGGSTGLFTSADDSIEAPSAEMPPINNSLLLFECTPLVPRLRHEPPPPAQQHHYVAAPSEGRCHGAVGRGGDRPYGVPAGRKQR